MPVFPLVVLSATPVTLSTYELCYRLTWLLHLVGSVQVQFSITTQFVCSAAPLVPDICSTVFSLCIHRFASRGRKHKDQAAGAIRCGSTERQNVTFCIHRFASRQCELTPTKSISRCVHRFASRSVHTNDEVTEVIGTCSTASASSFGGGCVRGRDKEKLHLKFSIRE